MGFLWEGSTGARAVQLLKELPQGTVIDTNDFAARLEVKPGALHQLLANAVNLRLIKKMHIRGHHCVGWKLGPGNDSVTIERRKPQAPPTPAEIARRRAATERRRRRADARNAPRPPAQAPSGVAWPPGFVSTFASPSDGYQPPVLTADELDADVDAVAPLPTWLRGLISSPAPVLTDPPPIPRPLQLPLFDSAEVGPGGRARWRLLDLSLPVQRPTLTTPNWRQTTFLEV